MYQGQSFNIKDFSGGYCGNLSSFSLQTNQAQDLDNIVIKPGGLGFRSRWGNSLLGSPTSANTHSLGTFLQSNGTLELVAVSGTTFKSSANFGGTFTDRTGALTITNGSFNFWDFVQFNSELVAFGGPIASPDAPFKWTGSGNASALAGSPPSAYGAFSANNRMFAFRTAANPSTIYWSIIGSSADWTGSGSGSTTVGSVSDGNPITAAAVISANTALIFKENSIYGMNLTTAPFSTYNFSSVTGCVGKRALVNVDNTIYFINSRKRMQSTDGNTITDYPNAADNLFDVLDLGYKPYITGWRQRGSDYDWIVWTVKWASNVPLIIWDLLNKCWLKSSDMISASDYPSNLVTFTTSNNQQYFGSVLNGGVYQVAASGTYLDNNRTGQNYINAYWRSGWLNPGNIDQIVQVSKLTSQHTANLGSFTVNYGFNFLPDTANVTISSTTSGGETLTSRSQRLTGRGNTFQFRCYQSTGDGNIRMDISSILLNGKVTGQKLISAP